MLSLHPVAEAAMSWLRFEQEHFLDPFQPILCTTSMPNKINKSTIITKISSTLWGFSSILISDIALWAALVLKMDLVTIFDIFQFYFKT